MKKSKVYKVYLIYFICMAIFCCLRIASAYGLFNALHPDIADIIYTLLIQVGIMVILPLVLYTLFVNDKKSVSKTFKDAGFNKVGYRVILISLALGLLAFFANIIISTLFGGFISFFGYNPPSGSPSSYQPIFSGWAVFLIQIVLVAVLPAICEEFLHRGILLGGTTQIGVKKSIIMSSLLFGLIHFNINQFFYAFILGMLMALVVVVARSIVPAIIIHFVNNAISVYLSNAEVNGWFGKNFYNVLNNFIQSNNILFTFIATFAFAALIVSLIAFLVVKLFNVSTLNRVQGVIKDIHLQPENSGADTAEKNKIIQELIEENTTLNINYKDIKSPLDIVLPKQKNIYKPKVKDNIFLISACVLGGLITFFTFCWGLF